MKHSTFAKKTVDNWSQKAEETLKGKSIQTLKRHTYENIDLKPLYTSADLENLKISEFPGGGDFRRGTSSLGYVTQEWKIAQKLVANNGVELQKKIETAFKKGQSSISFELKREFIPELSSILEDKYLQYPFSLDAEEMQDEFISELVQLKNSHEVSGYIAMDPLAILVSSGALKEELSHLYRHWSSTIKNADKGLPKLKTILIDTTPYHNGGANAIQEIAFALSSAVFHIENLKKNGLEVETIFGKIVFKFEIGANFFIEIAKLRAARLLWSKIAESYGVGEEDRKMTIAAETSHFTKTVYDPYVNLLRAGNEAFAAVLGGIDYLHVTPFNEVFEEVDSFSDRLARNTQLILKEEAFLTKVVDPSGGSWYVEYLTNELSKRAWTLFLEIEDKNGIFDCLSSGWIQEQVNLVREKKEQDGFTRKQSIIGTNIYANLSEQVKVQDKNSMENIPDKQIEPIKATRLAKPFEQLRQKAEQMDHVRVGLICLGELKNHKARADFISGFLAPGGIVAQKSEAVYSLNQAIHFINETKASHYFICGSNKQYDATALQLVEGIHKDSPETSLYLAGVPDEAKEEWLQAGIKQFIHLRSNCYEFLSTLLNEMQVKNHE